MIKDVIIPVKENDEETLSRVSKLKRHYNKESIYTITNEQKQGLAAKFNFGINSLIKDAQDEEWIVLQHIDAHPISSQYEIETKLKEASDAGADVVAVAGSLIVPPLSPGFWWVGLGTPQFRGSGVVQHPAKIENKDYKIMSFYGPYPQFVVAFDGLWVALKVGSLKKMSHLRFDEETFDTDYHYYDSDFSATCRMLGAKVYVPGIVIHHDSPGASMHTPEFLEAQKKFMKKWWKRQKDFNNVPK